MRLAAWPAPLIDFGEGWARPKQPGVYARVGGNVLSEWTRSQAPTGVG